MPTQQEIEEAKKFALKRVEASAEAKKAIRLLLLSYADRYSDGDENIEVLKGECANDVNEIVRKYALLSAMYMGDNDGGVSAFMNETHSGKTFLERFEDQVENFFYDLSNIAKAVGAISWGFKPEKKIFEEEYVKPYRDNSFISLAIESGTDIRIPSYRKGVPKAGAEQIMASAGNIVNTAWGFEQFDVAKRSGAVGYYVYRGSSYPCQTCQEATGFHKMEDEYFSAPPLHANCVCFAVYVSTI